MIKTASISPDGKYRYKLSRTWNQDGGIALFVGLNPSTADANLDDPTIRRCIGFARGWGYGGIFMGNLFAFRSTDPSNLLSSEASLDMCGPENEASLWWMYHRSHITVVCWGAFIKHPRLRGCETKFLDKKIVSCLGITKDGYPRHPLYLSSQTSLVNYVMEGKS